MVELAVCLPVFLILVLGLLEIGAAIKHSHTLTAAVREGGRVASMDMTDLVPDGKTANQKVIQDVRTFLTAAGIPGDQATITITHAEGELMGQDFDLQDPDNYQQMFRITATIPYSQVSPVLIRHMSGQNLRASFAFRKGHSKLSS